MTKEEYEDFVLRYKGCGACFPLYLNLDYFEKKWFSAIQKDVAELETQIEKMKCCYNCSKWNDGECEESPKSKTFFCADFKCDNWEMFK